MSEEQTEEQAPPAPLIYLAACCQCDRQNSLETTPDAVPPSGQCQCGHTYCEDCIIQ